MSSSLATFAWWSYVASAAYLMTLRQGAAHAAACIRQNEIG